VNIDKALNELRQGGTTPIGLTYLTEPKQLKTNNPFYADGQWQIEKLADVNGFAGSDYESEHERARAREEKQTDFESMPLWNGKGSHIDKFLAKHENGTVYLKLLLTTYGQEQYRWKQTVLPTGRTIPAIPLNDEEYRRLMAFNPAPRKPSERQELDKPRQWRLIMIQNIVSIRFGGKVFS